MMPGLIVSEPFKSFRHIVRGLKFARLPALLTKRRIILCTNIILFGSRFIACPAVVAAALCCFKPTYLQTTHDQPPFRVTIVQRMPIRACCNGLVTTQATLIIARKLVRPFVAEKLADLNHINENHPVTGASAANRQ